MRRCSILLQTLPPLAITRSSLSQISFGKRSQVSGTRQFLNSNRFRSLFRHKNPRALTKKVALTRVQKGRVSMAKIGYKRGVSDLISYMEVDRFKEGYVMLERV